MFFADLNDIKDNFVNVGHQTGFSLQQFLTQIFVVLILFLVMYKFAWKKVQVVLEERRKAIEESLANADRIKSQLADTESSRLAIIQTANQKAAEMIAETEKTAAVLTEQRSKEATRQAEDIIKNAREASVIERNRLMAELKSHLGELVIQTTQKVTGKVLSNDDLARLNTETVRQLEASNN